MWSVDLSVFYVSSQSEQLLQFTITGGKRMKLSKKISQIKEKFPAWIKITWNIEYDHISLSPSTIKLLTVTTIFFNAELFEHSKRITVIVKNSHHKLVMNVRRFNLNTNNMRKLVALKYNAFAATRSIGCWTEYFYSIFSSIL